MNAKPLAGPTGGGLGTAFAPSFVRLRFWICLLPSVWRHSFAAGYKTRLAAAVFVAVAEATGGHARMDRRGPWPMQCRETPPRGDRRFHEGAKIREI